MTHSDLRPPPARLRLPRRLTQAVFALSLACLMATLLSTSAHASGWLLTYSATGTETTTPFDPAPLSGQTFSDSATGTNTVASTKTWSSGFDLPGGTTTNMSVTVTVNGKWTGSDPPRPRS